MVACAKVLATPELVLSILDHLDALNLLTLDHTPLAFRQLIQHIASPRQQIGVFELLPFACVISRYQNWRGHSADSAESCDCDVPAYTGLLDLSGTKGIRGSGEWPYFVSARKVD